MSKPVSHVTSRELEVESGVTKERGIKFDLKRPSRLYCLVNNRNSTGPSQGQWKDRNGVLEFLKTLPKKPLANEMPVTGGLNTEQSLVLIAGTGNGTLLGLSLDKGLFETIIQSLEFPDKVERTIKSIHGVFARFIEHHDDGKRSLRAYQISTRSKLRKPDLMPAVFSVILLSSPKTPVREIFCAIRVDLVSSVTTCLLFDATAKDLSRVIKKLNSSGPAFKLVRQNPLAFVVMILMECGVTSESKRSDLDQYILGAEVQTRASSWEDPGQKLVRWPHNFYSVMSVLHLCQNNLMFVNHAVEFEVSAWEFFQRLASEEDVRQLLKAKTGDGAWQAIRDDIDYELAHTNSRKAQIGCLRERVGVQISMIDNMVAHQETSQTSLIAILALVFAPASLIASIFSAGIFPTSDKSWVPFISSTLPITLVTVAIGVIFLERQLVVRAWWRKPSHTQEVDDVPAREITSHEDC
ncbi:hypothetical protein B0J13DRAFT_558313 [Dactylonectria estremocensis]|uniref:Uncharacterized protein n=1 Tax=Dactylonectria estremocensis TaxID=1079267 RepID=A0A9P9EM81_9HYPO|nr:hypothetical protein B0J13DRAFT_558313 [Dactylonectria estremocensis]